MTIDLNDADPQRDQTLIDPGVYQLRIKVRPGGHGPGNVLRLSKSGHLQMLDLELVVVGGEHDGRKLYENIIVSFDDSGQNDIVPSLDPDQVRRYRTAVRIGLSKARAILESAHAIEPNDESESAKKRRRIEDFLEFDNLRFWAQVEIKAGGNGYGDRNFIDFVITPDLPDYPKQASRQVVPLAREMDDEIPF
jgi:hypothetical protein